jgi:hypothetical protein
MCLPPAPVEDLCREWPQTRNMKPFVWITALVLALPFLAGAGFTAYDVVGKPDLLTNPEAKVAVGWLFTGLMFLGMGVRGWRAHRRTMKKP